MKKRKGFYSISVVAKMFSVHQQTVRMYEKQGLITPKRSEGNTRLFAEEDVDRLEEVIYLTHKLGVNLAGVEIILKLQKKIKRMQDEMNKLFKSTETEFEIESQQIREDIKKQAERLVAIKRENQAKMYEDLIDIQVPAIDDKDKKVGQKSRAVPKQKKSESVALVRHKPAPENDEDGVNDFEIEYEK